MRKTVYNIREMSDSKEVYGQRSNPVLTVFIYTLLVLLLAAGTYAALGKIDITATAHGLVRPNENISTLSSMRSGTVTELLYHNGQMVKAGELLLRMETRDLDIRKEALETQKKDLDDKITWQGKFIRGVQAEENPFSENPESAEYAYYIKFRDYELTKQNSVDNFVYDESKAEANVAAIQNQIYDLSNQINGLTAFKNSVVAGENLATEYPDYESMYLLYVSTMESLKNDYDAQRMQMEQEQAADNSGAMFSDVMIQSGDYALLIDSIQQGASLFPEGSLSQGKLLYDSYAANLAEYERVYQKAKDTYDYYVDGGTVGDNANALLAYDKTMLEGYQTLQSSIEAGADLFTAGAASSTYQGLYTTYKAQYDTYLTSDPVQAETFKQSALAEAQNKILEIEAGISQKEVGLGLPSSDYNTAMAKTDMDSAKATVDAYKNKMLAEYQKVLSDLRLKMQQLQSSVILGAKEGQLSALDTKYNTTQEQQYLKTITDIDVQLQSLQTQLISAQSNLEIYLIAAELYQKNKDEDGNPISISLSSLQQLSTLISEQEQLETQRKSVEEDLAQTEEQLRQSQIVATQDGVVNILTNLAVGDTVSAGTAIATIIPQNESQLKVELYVKNQDLGSIALGDAVSYNIAAFPRQQYGSAGGTISSIASDTLIQDGQYSGYFLVTGTLNQRQMSDGKGNTGDISVGMELEGKIVTQRKTILQFLLEKINPF